MNRHTLVQLLETRTERERESLLSFLAVTGAFCLLYEHTHNLNLWSLTYEHVRIPPVGGAYWTGSCFIKSSFILCPTDNYQGPEMWTG